MRRLAREALRIKWAEPQQKNMNNLATMCPFCWGAWKDGGSCGDCLAPPALCADWGHGGVLGILVAKHGDILMLHLPREEFAMLRKHLVPLPKEGLVAACLRVTAPSLAETVPPE